MTRMPICLSDKRDLSTHSVKVQRQLERKDCILRSHPLKHKFQEWSESLKQRGLQQIGVSNLIL